MSMQRLVESSWFQRFIIAVILFNGLILGLETYRDLDAQIMQTLIVLDKICLAIFVAELLMKLIVYRLAFFRDGWNVFDFIIVTVALVPASGQFSILRAFRIFRVLRLITTIDSIRRVVTGMITAPI